MQPRLLILDEAVSALDKSIEAQVLNLLLDLKRDFGLTYMFITHDLNVVRFMSDRIMVMYLGRIAELGPAETIFESPRHPYTAALLASMPSMDPDHRTEEAPLAGDPPNPIDPPSRLPLPPPLQDGSAAMRGGRARPCSMLGEVISRRATWPIQSPVIR